MLITQDKCRIAATRTAAMLAAMLLSFGAAQARANEITGTSSGFGESVNLTVLPSGGGGLVTITSGPLPLSSGTAPSPYNVSNTAASASAAGLLSTGILTSGASSGITGGAGAFTTLGTATVDNLGVSLLSLLGITAGVVTSTSQVTGPYGALAPVGTTTIAGLSIAGLAPFGATITPAANDIVLNLAGIEVTLNKQVSSTAAGAAAITTDAIAIDFTNILTTVNGTLGLLNGEIDIAGSSAAVTATNTLAVSEPAAWTLLVGSLLTLALLRRRKIERC